MGGGSPGGGLGGGRVWEAGRGKGRKKVSDCHTASPNPFEETKFHRGTLGLIQRFSQRGQEGVF